MLKKPASPYGEEKITSERAFIDILAQMIVGTIIATATIMSPVIFIYAIYLVGTLLPPESKEASDPTPDSFPPLEVSEVAAPAAEMSRIHQVVTFDRA